MQDATRHIGKDKRYAKEHSHTWSISRLIQDGISADHNLLERLTFLDNTAPKRLLIDGNYIYENQELHACIGITHAQAHAHPHSHTNTRVHMCAHTIPFIMQSIISGYPVYYSGTK